MRVILGVTTVRTVSEVGVLELLVRVVPQGAVSEEEVTVLSCACWNTSDCSTTEVPHDDTGLVVCW